MAKRTAAQQMQSAELDPAQIPSFIERIRTRIAELQPLLVERDLMRLERAAQSCEQKIAETLSQVFGRGSEEYYRYKVHGLYARSHLIIEGYDRPAVYVVEFHRAIEVAISTLETAISMLKERLEYAGISPIGRARRAIDGLNLHRDIEEAAGQLFRDGHYSNAVLAAANALTALVRYRSGHTQDGVDLMNTVFSVGKPILKFNDLIDESDRNEQKGFMMLLAGAVTALRNPRAHKRIEDDAEEAVEFIAFINLLAKRVDRAKRS
jgi:uncharacterized protein (TIGR02391 family)